MSNCEIKKQEALKVLQVSTRTSMKELPDTLGKIFYSVWQYLQEIGENVGGPAFAVYHNQDMSDLQIDAGYVVSKDMPEKDNIRMGAIPESKVASCIHVGPYSELVNKYAMLMNWAAEQDLDLVGTGIEFYHNSPMDTPPEELKTEIIFPIK